MLKKFKASEINLQGSMYTLHPAAEKYGADPFKVGHIVSISFYKLGLFSIDLETRDKIMKRDPVLPDMFTKAEITRWTDSYSAENHVYAGLLSLSEDGTYTFTDLMINILNESKKNLELIRQLQIVSYGCPREHGCVKNINFKNHLTGA